MVISVCSNVVFAADTQATVGKARTTMNPANRLIYMDESMKDFTFASTEFGGLDGGTWDFRYAPIAWPITEKTGEDKVINVPSMATIDTAANTLTSKVTGVTYTLPAKITHDTSVAGATLSGAEALVVDKGLQYGEHPNAILAYEYDIPTNEMFDKVHILVATTSSTAVQTSGGSGNKKPGSDGGDYSSVGWTRAGAISAYPIYSDETTGISGMTQDEDYTVSAVHGTVFKRAIVDARDDDAVQEDMLVKAFPSNSQITESDRNGFLTELKIYESWTRSDSTPYDAGFMDSEKSMNVYEYTIDIDETKELDKIKFTNQFGVSKRGFIVLGVVGEEAGIGITSYYKDLMADTSLNTNAAKIYVDPTDPEEMENVSYNKKNFLGRGTTDGYNQFIAINWPLDLGTGDERRTQPPTGVGMPWSNCATITVDDNGTTNNTKDDIVYLTTNPPDHANRPRSGMTYTLKRDGTVGDGAKDAVLLCPRRADPNAVNGDQYRLPSSATIPVNNAPYNRIAILLAAAVQDGQDRNENIKIYATYTDGTKSIEDNSADDTTGAEGYVKGNMPTNRYGNSFSPNTANNEGIGPFVARLRASKYTLGDSEDENIPKDYNIDDLPATNTVTLENVGTTPAEGTGYLFEYTLTLDPTKTVESITVEASTTGVGTGYTTYGVRGCAVLGVAGEQAVVANPAEIVAGACDIEAYTTADDAEVYAAIYDNTTKALVAMGKAAAVPGGITNVTVEGDSIVANGEYDIKLFVWATDGTFKPLAGATSVN